MASLKLHRLSPKAQTEPLLITEEGCLDSVQNSYNSRVARPVKGAWIYTACACAAGVKYSALVVDMLVTISTH